MTNVSNARLDELKALRDRFRELLVALEPERAQRRTVYSTPHGPEVAWQPYEREQMLDAVNLARAGRRLGPVGIKEIERADRLAAGHSDYADKFTWACAELALK